MLNTEREIIKYCEDKGKHIYDIVLEDEITVTKKGEQDIRKRLSDILHVMDTSAKANLNRVTESKFNMIDGFAKAAKKYAEKGDGKTMKEPLCGNFLMEAMAMAFSTSEVNCSMGKIVAAPTAGSAGIMPAVMVALKKKYSLSKVVLENGLLTSIGIGQIIGKYATFAGAEGGCQAECGAASSMAAAAIVEMLGGTVEQALNAASFSLINVMGLVCDPIAGLVQYPCTFRNASGVMNAVISADMAFAGIKSIVPFDEVVQSMGEVGRALEPEFRETGLGGLAGTKTGTAIREEFLKK